MKHLIIFLLIIKCFFSCGSSYSSCNLREAKLVLENFAKEYTGLDTLIRLDGYYYRKENTRLILPIVFSENSDFKKFRYGFNTHEELQNAISLLKPSYGNYTIVGDTIKAKWVEYHDLWSCSIYANHFLIVNDTTLRQIWYSCETCRDIQYDTDENSIYHFVKYP